MKREGTNDALSPIKLKSFCQETYNYTLIYYLKKLICKFQQVLQRLVYVG